MIEEFEDDAVGLSLGKGGGGYWYVLLNSSGVEGKKEKSLSARRLREE